MSGLMNHYFYGKAGQGDYTVEQMPTNRRQLFFTTLKVRFSSMMGLNFLHFLFMVPALIWLYISVAAVMQFVSADSLSLDYKVAAELSQNETIQAAYDDYAAKKKAFDDVFYADEKIAELELKVKDAQTAIETIDNGGTVENPGSVTGVYTREELVKNLDGYNRDLAIYRSKLEMRGDEEYVNQLRTEYAEAMKISDAYTRQVMNSNILTSLVILVPLIAWAGIGRTGQAYVLRNWARDEHSFVWDDYKETIKKNWKQGLGMGILNGLSFVIFFVAYTTYGSMASTNWVYAIPQGIIVVLLMLWWMANELVYFMMVTYKMRFRDLIKNSIIMAIGRLPIAFLILLGTVAVPAAILMLIPEPLSLLILLILYGLIGFSFTAFVQASFANACFDKYLNPRIEGAVVNRGLYVPEKDEEEEAPVEQKEERFWEHKTK